MEKLTLETQVEWHTILKLVFSSVRCCKFSFLKNHSIENDERSNHKKVIFDCQDRFILKHYKKLTKNSYLIIKLKIVHNTAENRNFKIAIKPSFKKIVYKLKQ